MLGHWDLPEPLLRPEKIGIDTGAWRTGVLTAVCKWPRGAASRFMTMPRLDSAAFIFNRTPMPRRHCRFVMLKGHHDFGMASWIYPYLISCSQRPQRNTEFALHDGAPHCDVSHL